MGCHQGHQRPPEATRLLCPWDFSRQEYWSGSLVSSPGGLPNPGIEHTSPASPATKEALCDIIGVIAKATMAIILQCIHVSNQQVVHLEITQLYVKYISTKKPFKLEYELWRQSSLYLNLGSLYHKVWENYLTSLVFTLKFILMIVPFP